MLKPLVVLTLGIAPSCFAGLIGNVVGAQYELPNVGAVVTDLGTQTAGAGVEFLFNNMLSIDLTDNQIHVFISNPSIGSLSFGNNPFQGFRLYDVNGTIPRIASITIDPASNLAGFDATRLTGGSNGLFVNLAGLTFKGPASPPLTNLILDVNFATPEPATWPLVAAGLALVAVTRRARRARA